MNKKTYLIIYYFNNKSQSLFVDAVDEDSAKKTAVELITNSITESMVIYKWDN